MQCITKLTLCTAILAMTISSTIYAEQNDKEQTNKMAREMATSEQQATDGKQVDTDQQDKEARAQAKEILRQMQKKLSTQ